MDYNENDILEAVIKCIKEPFKSAVDFYIVENKAEYNSLKIKTRPSIWFNNEEHEYLLCRLKTKGKVTYISFPEKIKSIAQKYEIKYTEIKSDGFMRINLTYFLDSFNTVNFTEFINESFLKSFDFAEFGCCCKYAECEKQQKCLHNDVIYATACQFRKLKKL